MERDFSPLFALEGKSLGERGRDESASQREYKEWVEETMVRNSIFSVSITHSYSAPVTGSFSWGETENKARLYREKEENIFCLTWQEERLPFPLSDVRGKECEAWNQDEGKKKEEELSSLHWLQDVLGIWKESRGEKNRSRAEQKDQKVLPTPLPSGFVLFHFLLHSFVLLVLTNFPLPVQ